MDEKKFQFLKLRVKHGTCTYEEYTSYTEEVNRREEQEKLKDREKFKKQEECSHPSYNTVQYMYGCAKQCTQCGKLI